VRARRRRRRARPERRAYVMCPSGKSQPCIRIFLFARAFPGGAEFLALLRRASGIYMDTMMETMPVEDGRACIPIVATMEFLKQ
jgi:hypothetical protein